MAKQIFLFFKIIKIGQNTFFSYINLQLSQKLAFSWGTLRRIESARLLNNIPSIRKRNKFLSLSFQNGFVECLKQQCPNIEGCYALLDPRDDECCHKCTGRIPVRPLIRLIILIILIGSGLPAPQSEWKRERWKGRGRICRWR